MTVTEDFLKDQVNDAAFHDRPLTEKEKEFIDSLKIPRDEMLKQNFRLRRRVTELETALLEIHRILHTDWEIDRVWLAWKVAHKALGGR